VFFGGKRRGGLVAGRLKTAKAAKKRCKKRLKPIKIRAAALENVPRRSRFGKNRLELGVVPLAGAAGGVVVCWLRHDRVSREALFAVYARRSERRTHWNNMRADRNGWPTLSVRQVGAPLHD